jgi:hypothetical protein
LENNLDMTQVEQAAQLIENNNKTPDVEPKG